MWSTRRRWRPETAKRAWPSPCSTLTAKFGYALSVGIAYPLLDLIGFSGAQGASNSPGALTGILVVFVLLPALLLVTATALLWRFPLGEREHMRLRKQIATSE